MQRTSIIAIATFATAVLAFAAPPSFAQVTSTSTGGAGGSGGSAAGGTATGGTSTNTNNTTGGTSSATGGTSSAAGGSSNIGSATSNSQAADVSVNYITPAGAAGVNGLAPGVDPSNNHVVSDNNVHYSGTTKIKNTPDVSIGGPASGPCNGASGGLGVSVPGVAVGANVSTVDKGCEARETARVAAMLGRMDVANAILENMDVVVAALHARGQRDAQASAEAERSVAQAKAAAVADAAVAAAVHDAAEAQRSARDREAQAMRVQQQAGTEALARQATMAKVNDTLSFTGKLTQGEEKTPQQLMVEDLAAKQASNAAQKAASDPVPAPAQNVPAIADQPPQALQQARAPQPPLAQQATQPAAQQQAQAPAVQSAVDRDAAARRLADQAAVDRGASERRPIAKPAASGSEAPVPAPLMAAARTSDPVARPTQPAHRDPVDRKHGAKDDGDDALRFALGLN